MLGRGGVGGAPVLEAIDPNIDLLPLSPPITTIWGRQFVPVLRQGGTLQPPKRDIPLAVLKSDAF